MNIFVVGSKASFERMASVRDALEAAGHTVTLPALHTEPGKELEMQNGERAAYIAFKAENLLEQGRRVAANDAVLVMNLEKNGVPNYIGGATFLEVFKAWELGKKIFFYNELPDGILHDELVGMDPVVIHGDLSLIV